MLLVFRYLANEFQLSMVAGLCKFVFSPRGVFSRGVFSRSVISSFRVALFCLFAWCLFTYHYFVISLFRLFAILSDITALEWKLYIFLRASIFNSIAIELNVPRDDFSSIAIELAFVTLGRGFKKAGSVLFEPIHTVCILQVYKLQSRWK